MIIAAKRMIKVEYSLYSMLSLLAIVCSIVAWILTAEKVGLRRFVDTPYGLAFFVTF